MKKEELSSLFMKFDEYFEKGLADSKNPKKSITAYDYRRLRQKTQITAGLIFWQFIREVLRKELSMSFSGVREFLAGFIKGEQKEYYYFGIVGMIESLPDLVWRKLVWRENIDLMSYEAILRRLDAQQEQAIIDNYNDLFSAEPKLPRVFQKSWRDRAKIFFGKISVEKLLMAEYNVDGQRNMTKGAYAYNLLSLDFGFSLYPKGANDDTVLTNQKFTRFLSIKAHINDFAVNMEDGKYWQMYKTARSNYAFNPGKEIQIKDHICPGFWATLIRHAIFWIVSPLALLTSVGMILNYGLISELWVPAILALPNIVWLVVAFFRFILSPLSKLKIKVSEKTKKRLSITAIALALLVWSGWVLKGIIWFYPFFGPKIGYLLTILFIATALFYIVFAVINMGKKPLLKYKDIPTFAKFILHSVLIVFSLVILGKYAVIPVVHFLVKIAQSIWGWYVSDLLIINWSIATLIFIAIFIYFYIVFLKDEEKFVKYEKIFRWAIIGFWGLSVIAIGVSAYRSGSFDLYDIGTISIFIFSSIIISFFAILMMTKVNYSNIDERVVLSRYATRVDGSLSGFAFKAFLTKLRKSSWFMNLSDEDKWIYSDRIGYVANYYFSYSRSYEYRNQLKEHLIENGNVEVIDLLWNKRVDINNELGNTDSLKLKLLSGIIGGMTVEEAFEQFYHINENSTKRKEKITKTINTIFSPLFYAFHGISWFFKKIKEFFLTLKDLWSLFNKLCPYVSRPEELK